MELRIPTPEQLRTVYDRDLRTAFPAAELKPLKNMEEMWAEGDGNNVEDPYDVKSEYLVGKVIWSSVILGKISRLVSNPLIFIPVILVPLAVILLSNFFQTISLARKIAKEEEEAAIREAVEQFRKKKELEKQDSIKESDAESQKPEETE